MKFFDFASPSLEPNSTVVSVGVYDGVHRGHQFTLSNVIAAAKRTNRSSLVATFDRHPAQLIHPESAPKMLCDLEQRLEIFDRLGIDIVTVIPFTKERSLETPEDFVETIIFDKLGAGQVFVGENFCFGRDRRGDVALLQAEGRRAGIEVEGVALQKIDGVVVSSTKIRELLFSGNVAHARDLLGRVHELKGVVVRGDGRGGSELGFATANLSIESNLVVPGVGIYAGWYRDETHEALPAAISVGRRPTFYEDSEPLVEVHVIDFEGDLYDANAKVSFAEHLRDEVKFDHVDALVTQMTNDVGRAREICAESAAWRPKSS